MDNINKQLEFFLTHCEDVTKVSFITKGVGCLVLRNLISKSYGWQEKFRLNKVINVNPVNCGSDLLEFISRCKIFNFIFGPLLKESTPQNAKSISKLPNDVNLGLIFCDTWISLLLKPIINRFKGVSIKTDITESDFSDKNIYIKNKKYNIFNNPNVVAACLNFLSKNSFE